MTISISFSDEDGELHESGDVATASAWAAFVEWVETLPEGGFTALGQLTEHGHTFDLDGLAAQLRQALDRGEPSPDVKETGELVLDALEEPPVDDPVGIFASDGAE